MANDPNSIRLGACRVRWGNRDLGLTKGGIDVTVKTDTKTIDVDQFGKTIVQEYVMGRMVNVKVPFAETDLDTLYALTKQTGGKLTDTGTRATGTFTFTGGAANDAVIVAGRRFTLVTAITGPDQVLIDASQAVTLKHLVRALSSSSDAKLTQASYTSTANTVVVTAYKSGVAGNAFTIAADSTAITVSGATLTGGTDPTSTRFVSVQSGAGIGMFGTALPLVLHPIDRADNDYSEDFVVPLANTAGSITFAYKVDNERIFNVEFTGYVDTSSKTLFTYGETGVY